jgi:hypothetical protein
MLLAADPVLPSEGRRGGFDSRDAVLVGGARRAGFESPAVTFFPYGILMIESRRLCLQLRASCVAGLMACASHADSVSTKSYANLVAFDTAHIRVASRTDTARLTVELARSTEQQTMAPCTSVLAAGCPSYVAGARYVAALEVNAGYFARKQIRVGDRVLLEDTVSRRPASRPHN